MVVAESFVPLELWQKCMDILQDEMQLQQFNTWLRPLKVMADDDALCLLAPNRFVLDWVKDKFLPRIEEVMDELSAGHPPVIALGVTTRKPNFSGRRHAASHRSSYSKEVPQRAMQENADDRGLHYLSELKQKAAFFESKHPGNGANSKVGETSNYNIQKSLDLGEGASTKDITRHSSTEERTEFSERLRIPELSGNEARNHSPLGVSASRFNNPLHSYSSSTSGSMVNTAAPRASSMDKSVNTSATSLADTEKFSRFSSLGRHSSPVSPAGSPASDFFPEREKKAPSSFQWSNEKHHAQPQSQPQSVRRRVDVEGSLQHHSSLNTNFTFDTFVEGKSNQLALAAARQIVENPGTSYNPLFLYGGVGLGKTHLMHAVGNHLVQKNNKPNIVYLHSERFVADMVKALQLNAINDFKRYYRSVDALLIDDIQFFSGKDRSQEEFFHTFNALLEGGQQVILTCDRYPKEIKGLEERLKSRFGWGLTVAVEPPELETRVAILMKKAEQARVDLPSEAAFFIAQRLRSNVRELEGALKRVIASAHFMGAPIDIDLIREALKDLLALQDKLVSIDNIQRTVAEYYRIKMSDILSKTRARAVARPRQISMALAKELTSHSLPEIGDAHGGRDHTTVLHACRKVKELISTDNEIANDYQQLLKSLTN